MRLNNKGFAISVILYAMIILIVGVLYLLLSILSIRHNLSKEKNNEVVDYINVQGVNTITNNRADKIGTNRILKDAEEQLLCSNDTKNCYYFGSNPDNYITFSGDLWRIVGVFSVNNVKYLKLIKNETVKVETADNYKIAESNVFSYLNNEFYNNLVNKDMINPMYWKNSEYSTNMKPLNAFNEEQSFFSSFKSYVGLIDGSDFGYTAGDIYLDNNLSSYALSSTNNWLALPNKYFTMSYSGTKLNVINNGNLISTDNKTAYIYPTVYIKKDIFIIGGNGTVDEPYVLSFN